MLFNNLESRKGAERSESFVQYGCIAFVTSAIDTSGAKALGITKRFFVLTRRVAEQTRERTPVRDRRLRATQRRQRGKDRVRIAKEFFVNARRGLSEQGSVLLYVTAASEIRNAAIAEKTEQDRLGLYGQANKRIWWMPWRQQAMKDVVACDKPRGAGKQALIRGFPNGATHPS